MNQETMNKILKESISKLDEYQNKFKQGKEDSDEKKETENEEEVVIPSVITLDTLVMLKYPRKYEKDVTEGVLESAKQMTLQAAGIMKSRLDGLTDYPITEKQWKQFLVDSVEKSKHLTCGYISLEELFNWLGEAVNVDTE